MKKIILVFTIFSIYLVGLHAQVITDTSKAGGRGGRHGVPISTIAGSITIPANTTQSTNTVNQVPATGSGSSNQTFTLEELSRKVSDLQDQLNNIQNKLPFQNMAVMVIEAGEKNMEIKTTETGNTVFLHQVKIDHPLCNANPKAIVIAMSLGDKDHMQLVNAFYNTKDQYWYISTPQLVLKGFDPVHLGQLQAVGDSRQADVIYNTEPFSENSKGLASAGPKYPKPGEKYSVLIFNQLPVVNPAYQQVIDIKKE